MYKLGCQITIGSYRFTQVKEVKIERSSRLLSSIASIELPLSAVFENKSKDTIEKRIQRGQQVTIELGYDDDLNVEFTGFVKDVAAKQTTVIACEDSMYLLRKPVKNKLFKKTTLKDLLKYVSMGFTLNVNVPNIDLNDFVLKNVTAMEALQKLKDEYGLSIFIAYDNTLFAGLAYTYNTGNVTFDLRNNVISNDLTFKVKDDLKYKVKAISILKNNQRIEKEFGDADGEQRTFHFYNIKDENKLKSIAENELLKYKYTGYRGTITTFGLPVAWFGMSANIQDANYPDRDGTYYIESVTSTFGQNGFRRTVELGIKL
jgi:phage protein D